ncbi:MAG: pilus assembly protein [Acidobacteriota bacterium]
MELAIALPILLALLIGIFEFARAYNIQQVVVNAAREGARAAVVAEGSQAAGVQAVQTYLNAAAIDTTTATITMNYSSSTGDPVTVTVSVPYDFVFLGPIMDLIGGGGGPGNVTLSSQTVMRKE